MYRLKIPAWVKSDLARFKEEEAAHFQSLEEKLARVRVDPRAAGMRTRMDLTDCYYLLLGGYMLFYVIAEETKEVRFFDIKKTLYSW